MDGWTDRRTDGRTDGWTNGMTKQVVESGSTRLKIWCNEVVTNRQVLTFGIIMIPNSLCLALFALLDCVPNFSSVWIIAFFPQFLSLSKLSS